jgi:hypothetical protein
LPEYVIVRIPEWSSSDAFQLLHTLGVDRVRLERTDPESDSPYFEVFIVSLNTLATRVLLFRWKNVDNIVKNLFNEYELDARIQDKKKRSPSLAWIYS